MDMKEFATKVTTDEALAEKLSKAASPDEAYAIAKEVGLTESFETFTAAMKKLNEAACEMSVSEINSIAGGSDTSDVVVSAVSSASIFGAFAAGTSAV